jgi:hypothetical protein
MKVNEAKRYVKVKPFINWYKLDGKWIGQIDGFDCASIESIGGEVLLTTNFVGGAFFDSVINAMKRAYLHIIKDLGFTNDRLKYLPTYAKYFNEQLWESDYIIPIFSESTLDELINEGITKKEAISIMSSAANYLSDHYIGELVFGYNKHSGRDIDYMFKIDPNDNLLYYFGSVS